MVVGYQAICRKVARPGGPQGDESRAELSQNAAPSICWAIHRHPRGLPESGPAPTATPPANRVGRIKERRGRHQVIQEIRPSSWGGLETLKRLRLELPEEQHADRQ